MRTPERLPEHAKRERPTVAGQCACGAVKLEIDIPARWAWHDHSAASRLAQGCAYATYVGSYKSRFRFTEGEEHVRRWADEAHGVVRGFCGRCGAPLTYERARATTMVNIPRALFQGRTGRETRYHMHLDEAAEWLWQGEPLAPLKGYPGVMWERPKRRKRRASEGMF
jgi:hypothetical protein